MIAPIVLFAYNRVVHLRACIEALKLNVYSEQSTLIIHSDGPKSEADVEEVERVREYISTISGFGKIELRLHRNNLGLSKSVLQGVSEAVNQFGMVIVLEDDLIPSKYFLKYMNDALVKFKNEEKVISIHGYIYPVKEKLPDIFFLRGADCWGWATWKRGWDLLDTNGQDLADKIEKMGAVRRFNFDNSYPYMQMLKDQIAGRNNSWAILWYASAFAKDRFTLYPGNSLVHNIGNDNSGTHSLATSRFDVVINDKEVDIITQNIKIEESIKALHAITNYFNSTQSRFGLFKTLVKRFFNTSKKIL